MKLKKSSALLVIDIQQEDFVDMNESNQDDPRWDCIRNARRVLDVFRKKGLPVIQIKEVHRPDLIDIGRELDGSEGIHCIETHPENDYAQLTYPIEGEYLISKRRYSAFFDTDLEILLRGLHVDTLYMIGGLTDVCVHYTAVDAHQNNYHIRVVTDAVAGSSKEANDAALRAIQYLQRDALVTVADIESTLEEVVKPEDETFMQEAIRLSRLAVEHGNEPFGAVLVKDGENRIHQRKPDLHETRPDLSRGTWLDPGVLRSNRCYRPARIYAVYQLRTLFYVQRRDDMGQAGKIGLRCK